VGAEGCVTGYWWAGEKGGEGSGKGFVGLRLDECLVGGNAVPI
jgi:hypothetical protein